MHGKKIKERHVAKMREIKWKLELKIKENINKRISLLRALFL